MTRFNPSQIANRIGRIVFATILAGVFIGSITLFSTGEYSSLSSPTEPLGMYLDAAFEVVVVVVVAGLVVPIVMHLYWGLSNRFSWTRKWQVLLSGTAIIAAVWTISDSSGAFDLTLGTLARAAYGIAILAAISIVEALSGTDVDLNPRQLATGTGALAIVFVFLIPVASITAGVMADPTTEEDKLEEAFNTEGEPYPNYLSVLVSDHVSAGNSGSADHLAADAPEERPNLTDEYTYNVSETHVGAEYFDLRTWNVERDGKTTAVKGHYEITLKGEGDNTTVHDSIVNSGVADVETADSQHSADASTPSGYFGMLRMEYTESMWVYYDVVADDGEVHRYMVYLERDNV